MTWFLLTYDRATRTLIGFERYSDDRSSEARADRETLIEKHIGDPNIEVVLLGSRSEEDLRITHMRYFRDTPDTLTAAAK